MSLESKNFGLFLTRGMSLAHWDQLGILTREIMPYQKLAEFFQQIFIFSYGSAEHKYAELFPKNVIIISKPKFLPSTIYSFLLPLIRGRQLRGLHILKTNQMDGAWAAVVAKKTYKAKLVIRSGYEWLQTLEKAHKSFLKRIFASWAEKFAYRNADKIILTSEGSRDFVLQRFAVDSKKIEIIPNFINTDLFKPLNISKEEGRIIFVGRLEREKNLSNLLSALPGSNAKLVLVGRGSEEAELREITKDKNLNVEFKGNIAQADLPNELNKSEVFILPSIYEGNPKALLEAMSSGLACIGANVAGINSIITNMEDGILSAPDPNSLKEAIKLLLGNKELCAKLGANAHRKIETQNSFPVLIKKELHIYDQILR